MRAVSYTHLDVYKRQDWTWAYLVIAVAAFAPFPVLAAMRAEPDATIGRTRALISGILSSLFILLGVALVTTLVGWALLSLSLIHI